MSPPIPTDILPFLNDHYFPLQPGGKIPFRGESWKHLQTTPVTPEERQYWAEAYPDANYAIITGTPLKTGGYLGTIDADGPDQIEWLYANLPLTTMTISGREEGGVHAHFSFPFPPATQTIGPGLLLKGVGGYVVAPGSLHSTGKLYQVVNPGPPTRLGEKAVHDLLCKPSTFKGKRKQPQDTSYGPPGSTRSHREQSFICRLIRLELSDKGIFSAFHQTPKKAPKFHEMHTLDSFNAARYLQRSIDRARRYLLNHDRIRRTLLSSLREIVIPSPRKAVRSLFKKLVRFARRFGVVKENVISFTASKRQLGDTAYRAFSALVEELSAFGVELLKIASKPHPRGRIASTYLLILDVTYGEMGIGEAEGAIADEASPLLIDNFKQESCPDDCLRIVYRSGGGG